MRRLHQLLRQYPPQVREILRLDHSLLSRPDSMESYPMLSGFLAQHPEISRNPGYYFGQPFLNQERSRRRGRRRARGPRNNVAFAVVAIVGEVLGVFGWIVRQIIATTAAGCARRRRRRMWRPSCWIG